MAWEEDLVEEPLKMEASEEEQQDKETMGHHRGVPLEAAAEVKEVLDPVQLEEVGNHLQYRDHL